MIVPVMGHLGTRVSALLDGQMPAAEEERWWQHVHRCHPCRDLVEREGWIKTRLAGLSLADASAAPDRLKDSLLSAPPITAPQHPDYLDPAPRRGAGSFGGGFVGGVVGGVLGSGAVGVAVVGVLALGAGPANAPQLERRAPVTSLTRPTPTPASTPSPAPATSDAATPRGEQRGTRSVRHDGAREKMGQ